MANLFGVLLLATNLLKRLPIDYILYRCRFTVTVQDVFNFKINSDFFHFNVSIIVC